MAQTKRKRRRKHRGTQGGKIDTRPKSRPRNRAEAKQRAQTRRAGGGSKKKGPQQRVVNPPTWGSAFRKGAFAGLIFFALLVLAFGRPLGESAPLAAFMLVFYVPMGYYTDRFFYHRHLRKQQQERLERSGSKQ